MPEDDAVWLADLESADADRRLRALHAACPYSGSFRRFEQYMPLLP